MENLHTGIVHIADPPGETGGLQMTKTIFDGDHRHLVEILTKARKESGLTQTQLAVRMRRDQTFISLIERGQRRVDVLEFIALAKALEVQPAKLFQTLLNSVDQQSSGTRDQN